MNASGPAYRVLLTSRRWMERLICVAIVLVLHLALSTSINAQVVLERSVIGALGGSETIGGHVLEYTAGEAVVQTVESETVILTQGFHQSRMIIPISVEIVVTDVTCPTSTDGAIELVHITGGIPPYEIVWSNGKTGASIDRLTAGIYSFTVVTNHSTYSGEAVVGSGDPEDCRLRFFNAFSPNGDGENDLWVIENIHLSEFSTNNIRIFNRWGQEVSQFDNYDNHTVVWDGTSESGGDLPVGTYFFVAEVGGVSHKGYIELIR